MKKVIKGIFATLVVVLAVGIIAIPSDARTLKSYAQKSIFSVLGDSISSYKGYESVVYYGPSGESYNTSVSNMWWSIYTSESNEQMGWSASVGSAQVAMDESNFYSFFYPSRLSHLDNNGTPDYIAVFGGTNDANAGNSASSFYSSYNRLINKLHSMFDGIKLILMAPNYFPGSSTTQQNTLINAYDNSISNIATNYNDYYVDLRGKYYSATDCVQHGGDVIHPNESGMHKIATAVEEALRNQRGETGIDSIRADLDYDYYIIKVNAYDTNYDNLNFKFKLTSSKGEAIYDTSWSKDNCFYLDEVDPSATYHAEAWIDNNGDGNPDGTFSRDISNLVKKRTGGSVYNGVDYSNVYDFNYYIDHYGDLYNAYRNDPNAAIEHFVKCGMSEGRQAKSDFDVVSYRNRYLDLRQAFGWKNLIAYYDHYRITGKREGRIATGCPTLQNGVHEFLGLDFSPVYDYNYYITHNPDVYNAFNGDENQVFAHFLTAGANEGRRASEEFDVYSYRNQWADLRQAFGWNNLSEYYVHYARSGKREGRKATGCTTVQNPIQNFFGYDFSSIYNYQYYIDNNPDIKAAFGGNDEQTFAHFLSCGMREGRRASDNFDVYSYRNQYSDLRQIFGYNNLAEYYLHYNGCGRREGRAGTGCDTLRNPIHTLFGSDISAVYDFNYYTNNNLDIKRAFGNDDLSVMIHFVLSGMHEGRQASPEFNVWTYANNNPDLVGVFGFDLPKYYEHYINCGKREGRVAV